jgi:hypothetical protein
MAFRHDAIAKRHWIADGFHVTSADRLSLR